MLKRFRFIRYENGTETILFESEMTVGHSWEALEMLRAKHASLEQIVEYHARASTGERVGDLLAFIGLEVTYDAFVY